VADGRSLCRDREALLFGGTPDGSHTFEGDGIKSGLGRLAAAACRWIDCGINALAALVCSSHIVKVLKCHNSGHAERMKSMIDGSFGVSRSWLVT